jgi:hypothetical protein
MHNAKDALDSLPFWLANGKFGPDLAKDKIYSDLESYERELERRLAPLLNGGHLFVTEQGTKLKLFDFRRQELGPGEGTKVSYAIVRVDDGVKSAGALIFRDGYTWPCRLLELLEQKPELAPELLTEHQLRAWNLARSRRPVPNPSRKDGGCLQ